MSRRCWNSGPRSRPGKRRTQPRRAPLEQAFVFIAYTGAAVSGLSFASLHPSASAIWPATGIAIAAFLVFGRRIWPAILSAAFTANLITAGSAATSIAIATGNTLEGYIAAVLTARFAQGLRFVVRPSDFFRFAGCAAVATAISPTIGVTSLSLSGSAEWNQYGAIWLTWWLGDLSGALIVTSLITAWWHHGFERPPGPVIEAPALLVSAAVSTVLVFGGLNRGHEPIAFACFPVLIWAAFRFGPREAATTIALITGIATWGTLQGLGPFGLGDSNTALLRLQAFVATIAMMVLPAAALVREQKRTEAERVRALRLAQADRATAIAANRAKDQFLAMLGHELRNPLTPIVTALELMKLKDPAGNKERSVIDRQVRHLRRLVDDLLDVSRITRGKIMLHREPIDIATIIVDALELVAPLIEQRGHRLDVAVPRGKLIVDGDRLRLVQVVSNLLTNAAKYTPDGGRIFVTGRRTDQAIEVIVRDTGVGIRADMLDRVFELFSQAEQKLDRAEGGLGLGLALVRSLTELHGGRVHARSEGPGQGSEFTITLPASLIAAPTRAERLPVESVAAGPRLQVLIVDDNVDAAEMLTEALRAAGHRVSLAGDALEALEQIERVRPNVALLDIGLPVMDGYELAQRIREHLGPSVRLIAITGYGQEGDHTKAVAAGFDAHLVKPIDLDELNDVLLGTLNSGGR